MLQHVHINEDAGTIPQGSREKVTIKECDVFEEMRHIPSDYYDVMILDPPKLAKTKSQADQAAKAYKDLNRLAMQKIRRNGIIATFSCSGAIEREMFRTILAWASQDSNVELQILETLSAGSDHPVRVSFPESEYLKGYVLRVLK
jgi:23S rRNA (cytosine1962-C5)-methyltransferase